MKTICLSQTRCLTAVSLMLVGVLLTCYGVIVNLRHGGIQDIENVADVVPAEEDGDAEYLEKRHEFLDRFFGTGPGGVDRKSTRLNSSHSQISYAVFCLKK